ncbi:unnamed protein product [Rotaria sordida]|uniref:Uncharacterized protein n=1 Tax=Rotaria sordida TaxID=392033 RepID=A0A819DJM7_9BILA|nr:unnamed protein product [Rotaria sordida]CAF3839447.1 unnamed protein product [Rotaria sordida]
MNTDSKRKTSRGRVITCPVRYTPTSPSSSPSQIQNGSSITIDAEQIQQFPINNSRRSEESRVQGTQPSLRVSVDDNTASNTNDYSKSSNNYTDIYELIRKDINDVYVKLDNSLNVNMIKFERRLTKLTNICSAGNQNLIEQYKTSTNDGFLREIDFQGQNLLDIPAKNYADYGRQLLRILFTPKELCSSILPSSFNHYAQAMQNKYRISKEKYGEFFKFCLRRKLVDFLCDERKRQKKQYQLHTEGEQEDFT